MDGNPFFQSPDFRYLFRFCFQMSFWFYASQFWVDHDTSTVFAYDDFLAHTNVELFLRRNLVEATATSVTLYVSNTQTVA